MNSSILRCSLGATQSSALKRPSPPVPFGTWPAIFAGRSETSKLVMPRTPDSPAIRRFHTVSTPTPSGVTRPRPVTTTRLDDGLAIMEIGSGLLLDEIDGILHRHDLFGGFVRNLATEFLLEGHDQLDRVEAVGAKIVNEAGAVGHLGFIDAKVLHDDFLHSFSNITHDLLPRQINALFQWCAQIP